MGKGGLLSGLIKDATFKNNDMLQINPKKGLRNDFFFPLFPTHSVFLIYSGYCIIALFQVVQKLGGFNRVMNQNQWKVVSNKMQLQSLGSQAPNHIKAAYKRCVFVYDI